MAEARTCESQSHGFKGRCLSDHNCGMVCKNEGFSNGWCRGFRQRCFCTRAC
ncbi:PREDICTED: defensin-like protein 1 [Erythranthe guttata]|uniref:defensin-like protein 1 n=1 Tax=Erythranthe guttata TaxID=4155 RepID=UPI00064DB469|nr:PREDICTED: defensin-like protein 1 [Erythranthe guttata]|eukprot:XP_012848388.1 PREDICTED: defensin-like protein 1 [Erythranthe guttata]